MTGLVHMPSRLFYCSFCGKSNHEARAMVAGVAVVICDECLDVCVEIFAYRHRGAADGEAEYASWDIWA